MDEMDELLDALTNQAGQTFKTIGQIDNRPKFINIVNKKDFNKIRKNAPKVNLRYKGIKQKVSKNFLFLIFQNYR